VSVRLKLGVAIAPEHSLPSRASDEIQALDLDPPLKRDLALISRRDTAESPALQALLVAVQRVVGTKTPEPI